jgi:ribose/xylose/arabinose/galactoside ABC-type transport system permease subunit
MSTPTAMERPPGQEVATRPESPVVPNLWQRLRTWDEFGVVLALIVVMIGATLSNRNFLRPDNLAGILQNVTFLGFIAVGLSFALLAGEIDISVGSIYGLTSVVTALVFRQTEVLLLAIFAGLGVGIACGLVNGVVATVLRVPAVIITLATLGVYRGFALVLAKGASVSGLPQDEFFFNIFGNGEAFQYISWLTLLFLGVAVLAGLIVARTAFGFQVYAVGSNALAARLVGFDVRRVRIAVLTISGFTAGIAGVCSVAYLTSATPTGGTGYELEALAAVIIGGIKLTGGRGSILGTVIGLLVVGIIRNMLVLASVSTNWQQAVTGAVLAAAVAVDQLANRRVVEA